MEPPSGPPLEDRDIPPDVADQFRVAFGLDGTPSNLAEWAEATARLIETAIIKETFDDWCRVSTSRHEIRSAESAYYRGLFDALLVSFIRANSAEFTIRSQSPVSERVVDVHIDGCETSFDPDGAVMSFGVATDVVATEYFEVPDRIAYNRFNQYTNAFASLSAYERWTDATPEAVTMVIPLSTGVALAQRVLAE